MTDTNQTKGFQEYTVAEYIEKKKEEGADEDELLVFVMTGKTTRWLIDASEWGEKHPGGTRILKRFKGKDITEPFGRVYHSIRAQKKVQELCVGKLKDDEVE